MGGGYGIVGWDYEMGVGLWGGGGDYGIVG